MRTKNKIITSVIIAVSALLILSGFVFFFDRELQKNEIPKAVSYADANYIELSFNEAVNQSTHILDAECVGVNALKSSDEFIFKPMNLIKGVISEDEIHVIVPRAFEEQPTYEAQKNYLLFLERNISVYYEHDKYVPLGEVLISSASNNWGKAHEETLTALNNFKGEIPPYYGVEFAKSDVVSEIIDFSDNIFEVEILSVYAESEIAPTTVYNCAITKTLKNSPADNNAIMLTLFNDTVKIGEKYVVLLGDATNTAPVYTLSSRNSVFTPEETLKIPELAELYAHAKNFETVIVTKTFDELLKEEQSFAR